MFLFLFSSLPHVLLESDWLTYLIMARVNYEEIRGHAGLWKGKESNETGFTQSRGWRDNTRMIVWHQKIMQVLWMSQLCGPVCGFLSVFEVKKKKNFYINIFLCLEQFLVSRISERIGRKRAFSQRPLEGGPTSFMFIPGLCGKFCMCLYFTGT